MDTYYKKYYENSKLKISNQKKLYYEKNKNIIKLKNKNYYEKNKELIKDKKNKNYIKKPKKIISNEERLKTFKKSVKNYKSKKLNCIHCNKIISYGYEKTHFKKYCKNRNQKKDDEDDNKSITSLELD